MVVAPRYATSLLRNNDFAAALRVVNPAFDCESWTALALTLRAAAYQRIFADQLAMESVEAAMRLYEASGRAAPESLGSLRDQLADSLSKSNPKEAAPVSDDGVVPKVRYAPNYPQRALRNGAVACVRLEFSVSDNGTIENARVTESTNKLFDGEALNAFVKWRYAPPLEDGLPVRRDGMQTVIRFELERRPPAPPC